MENYKELIQLLKDNPQFIEIVQETLDIQCSHEKQQDMLQWKQLVANMKELEKQYKDLIAELRTMRDDAMKVTYGNKLNYRIARFFMR